jgi:hypothetical protein
MTYKEQQYSWVTEKGDKTLWRCDDEPKKLIVVEGDKITEIKSLKEWING